jgi:hypothetical protein
VGWTPKSPGGGALRTADWSGAGRGKIAEFSIAKKTSGSDTSAASLAISSPYARYTYAKMLLWLDVLPSVTAAEKFELLVVQCPGVLGSRILITVEVTANGTALEQGIYPKDGGPASYTRRTGTPLPTGSWTTIELLVDVVDKKASLETSDLGGGNRKLVATLPLKDTVAGGAELALGIPFYWPAVHAAYKVRADNVLLQFSP